jgi:hypothetical protein
MESVLLKLAGAAAVAGGLLRIVNAFAAHTLDPHALALIYLATDDLLLLGLIGWYAPRASGLGASGAAGFAGAVTGFLTIRSAAMFPGYGYPMGAALLLAGLVVMSARELLRRKPPSLPAWFWLASFACAMLSILATPLVMASAILFSAGFICAGLRMLKS